MIQLKQKIPLVLLCLLLLASTLVNGQSSSVKTVSLNGEWQMGFSRKYTQKVQVPGIATDPTHAGEDTLWYQREIKLPLGGWTEATLELKGARFRPSIYVNGNFASQQEGGMAPIFFNLKNSNIKPGATFTLEIALASLKDVPPTDASYTPTADQFRSDISSSLWDDVILHLHGNVSISSITPFTNYADHTVNVHFDLNNANNFVGKATVQIIDAHGRVCASKIRSISGSHNTVGVTLNGDFKSWSPQSPNLYHLKLSIANAKGKLMDQSVISYGVKSLGIIDKQFYMNGNHFIPRGVTVVWHRWMRTPEGRDLGYDTAWFKKNIIKLSKDHGANYVRFHLGLPPERLLDLCDKYGLAVQYEWSFFHGMPASKQSLLVQYKSWLDLAMKHPCVSFFHPYNETSGDGLKVAWAALDELLASYPPLIFEDRDVIHVHKYWWSMFENLGLYYDNANVFPKAIIADEFGGNYLDQNGNPGTYSSLKESFLRFLGRKNTVEERLEFHAESNARIAEYWRRIGAAGFSPFCALGSYEDGNSWFLGPLKQGNPKPVWDALTAAFSPRSVSIEIWDKNFYPGQHFNLPVYGFNDDGQPTRLSIKLTVENKDGQLFFRKPLAITVDAYSKKEIQVPVEMPALTGNYVIKAELINRPKTIKYPVISKWDVTVLKAAVPQNIKGIKIAIPGNETELKQFLNDRHITTVDLKDSSAKLILTSLATWNAIVNNNNELTKTLQDAIDRGVSVVMLDVGNRQLGQGYPKHPGDLGPLQGVSNISNAKTDAYNLFDGIILKFTETAEPESFLHPDRLNNKLWNNLPENCTRIWNGMRGGLIVPASSMEFSGLSAKAFIAQWQNRGASETKITTGPYYAYELQGFYDFSDQPNDPTVKKKLKDKVRSLAQDAPSLATAINLNSPVTVTDLNKGYHDSEKGIADKYIPLANCAKNLTQTPVALIGFGPQRGSLIISQLLTAGRLANGFGQTGLYGIRYDEAAVQYVLNMISLAIETE